MKKREKRNIAGDDEIAGIREKCYTNLEAQVSQPITQAMEHLRNFAFSNALIPDVPAITISVDTFRILASPYSGDEEDAYRLKGIEAGKIFAKRYIDFLRYEVGIPESIRHLLKGWAFFDTGANWGTFDIIYEKNQKKALITLKNSFLTRKLDKNKHRFCSFMEGYIEGLLWICLKYYPRLYEDIVRNTPPDENLEPVSVKEEPESDICRFIVSLKSEELVEAFDEIYAIEKRIEEGDFRKIPLEIRTILEIALKKKIDIKKDERIYVPQLLIPFKSVRFKKLNIQKISHVYGWACQDAHDTAKHSEEEIIKRLKTVNDFLIELEKLEISEKKRMLFRNEALDARAGKKGRSERGIFISYSHQDKGFVEKLVRDLQNSGVSIWIDMAEIKLGDSLIEKISTGIDKMEYLAVVLSPDSVNSSWVKKEVSIAINQEIEGKKIKVLPLLYRECTFPNFLQDKLFADFTKEERYEIALEMILDVLR